MFRSKVGLLAAAGTAMAALVSLVHGDLIPAMIVGAGTSAGLASYLATPAYKKVRCDTSRGGLYKFIYAARRS